MGTYRQEMDKVKLSEQKKEQLKKLYVTEKKEEHRMRRLVKPMVAAAACAAILLGAVVSGNLALRGRGDGPAQADDHDFTFMVNAAELTEDSQVVAYSPGKGDGWVVCGTDNENEVSYSIDTGFACEGEQIADITYRINQGAFQIIVPQEMEPGLTFTEIEPINTAQSGGEDDDVCYYASSYTVDYENQHPEHIWISICGNKQLAGYYDELFGEDVERARTGFEELLKDVVITCTVKFTDGTSADKEITVTPVIMTYREGSPSASELRAEDFESEEKMEEYLNEKGVFLVYELK